MNDQFHGFTHKPNDDLKPGFVRGMSNEDYHASKGISKSGLDKIARSPAHYKAEKPFKSTRAMEIGTAIHAAILEPERFDKEYVVADCDARTLKAYKDLKKEHGGELTLTRPEADKVNGMRESVEADLEIMSMLSMEGAEFELSAFAVDPETGINIRSRFDHLNAIKHFSIDVKKTQDIRKFAKSVNDYRYHVQDAFYGHVYKILTGHELTMFFLAIEEEAPHTCKLFEIDYSAQGIGEYYSRRDLNVYADCLKSGEWPGPQVASTIELPYYAHKQYEDEIGDGLMLDGLEYAE